MRRLLALLIAFAGLAQPALAVTVTEAGIGGDFSGSFAQPTLIDGADIVLGSWGHGGDYDFLALAGFEAGETLTLTFGAREGAMNNGFSAGGTIKWSYDPFPWGWSGTDLGIVQVDAGQPGSDVLTLTLGSGFAGTLYLGFYGTHGVLDYSIAGPATPDPDAQPIVGAVPVPPSLLLLAGGIGGLAAFRRRQTGRRG